MPEGREEIYMQRYERQNQAYWSDRAEGYSRVNRDELDSGQHRVWGEALAERIAAAYPGRRNEEITVLDIGTGPGFFAIILAERGYRVTAVDYTDSMLEKARLNAGIWRDRITFLKMNAEELQLPDRSFDVIVSRNVTWNLHDPVKAYSEWTRVLKEGGLLLNFDANWYRYLYDEEARKGYCRDRENIRAAGVPDETDGTDIPAMEAIAYRAPLSSRLRPEWDIRTLDALGMEAEANTEIWKTVWTREERINNASTPMFLVQAVRRGREA